MEKSRKTIGCVIIHSTPDTVTLFENYIEKFPSLQLKASFTNSFEALDFLHRVEPELIFCDTDLSEINGIQLINSLRYHPMVIFIAQNNQFAVDAFDVDALDYLVQPYAFERVLKAINRANDLFYRKENNTTEKQTIEVISKSTSQFAFVKSEGKTIRINFGEILYIEGFSDYVKIHTKDPKPILSLLNMKDIEEKLPPKQFIRVHRSYIVAIDKIKSIDKKRIYIGEHHIPISNSYHQSFFDEIERLNLK